MRSEGRRRGRWGFGKKFPPPVGQGGPAAIDRVRPRPGVSRELTPADRAQQAGTRNRRQAVYHFVYVFAKDLKDDPLYDFPNGTVHIAPEDSGLVTKVLIPKNMRPAEMMDL